MGHGDYQFKKNTLISGDDQVPSFSTKGDEVIIMHREPVGDLIGTNLFNVNYDLYLNPGNPILFPWLSVVSANFEEYEFKGLIFYYVPDSSCFSSTSQLGTVNFATEYNPANPTYSSINAMRETMFFSSSTPDKPNLHAIECAPSKNTRRNMLIAYGSNLTDVPSGMSFEDYYLGHTNIATLGNNVGTNLGTVYVSYQVKLMKPRLQLGTALYNDYSQHASGNLGTSFYWSQVNNYWSAEEAAVVQPFGLSYGAVTTGSQFYSTVSIVNFPVISGVFDVTIPVQFSWSPYSTTGAIQPDFVSSPNSSYNTTVFGGTTLVTSPTIAYSTYSCGPAYGGGIHSWDNNAFPTGETYVYATGSPLPANSQGNWIMHARFRFPGITNTESITFCVPLVSGGGGACSFDIYINNTFENILSPNPKVKNLGSKGTIPPEVFKLITQKSKLVLTESEEEKEDEKKFLSDFETSVKTLIGANTENQEKSDEPEQRNNSDVTAASATVVSKLLDEGDPDWTRITKLYDEFIKVKKSSAG